MFINSQSSCLNEENVTVLLFMLKFYIICWHIHHVPWRWHFMFLWKIQCKILTWHNNVMFLLSTTLNPYNFVLPRVFLTILFKCDAIKYFSFDWNVPFCCVQTRKQIKQTGILMLEKMWCCLSMMYAFQGKNEFISDKILSRLPFRMDKINSPRRNNVARYVMGCCVKE